MGEGCGRAKPTAKSPDDDLRVWGVVFGIHERNQGAGKSRVGRSPGEKKDYRF